VATTLPGPDVGDLVRQAMAREPGAWDALVDRFAELIWAVARGQGLGPADAADVSQTTWLRLAEHLDRIREPERLGAWLAVTARNEALRTLKRASRQVPTQWDSNTGRVTGCDEPSPDHRVLCGERDAALWRAFDGLSGQCKLLLRYLIADPPPSYADVSEVLAIPVGTIGPRRNRCLEHLRRDPGVREHQEAVSP
jgi:RNA polymerase sigma factor (sigma-70 family)